MTRPPVDVIDLGAGPGVPAVLLLDAEAAGWDLAHLKEAARAATGSSGAPFVSRSYRFPYALVAWHDAAVGVDLERTGPEDAALDAVISTPRERAGRGRAGEHLVSAHWCAKEALAKALGDARDYEPSRLEAPISWPGLRSGPWRARPLQVPAGHVGWLCWRDEAPLQSAVVDLGNTDGDLPAGVPAERVGDAERDHVAVLLREHCTAGRLTLDEFTERVGAALSARTRGELEATLADLPSSTAVPQQLATTKRRLRRFVVAVLSGASARGRYRLGQHTTAVAVMGGCQLDLRRAVITGPEIVITAVAVMGAIDIVVPEGIEVDLTGFALMGGRDLRVRDVPPLPGSPRILVRAFPVMGGVNVRSLPATTPADALRPGDGGELVGG